ncbi:MAG: molybdopterin-dependent oxidoreductase, partial [Spirochaetota bacterium]
MPRAGPDSACEEDRPIRSIPTFCGKDCGGDACPLLIEVEGDRVLRVRNNPAGGPRLSGCVRGFDLHRVQEAPGRLLSPLLRTGPRGSGQFREIGWDEALGLAAERLGDIRTRRGPASTLCVASAGTTGALHGTVALTRRFLNAGGGATMLAGSYSNAAARFILPWLLGPDVARSGHDPATLRHSAMIVLWGANVL